MRYKLTIAYDGTDFCGWQKQEPPAGSDVAAEKVLIGGGGERVQGGGVRREEGDAPAADRQGTQERITLRTVQEVVERAVREVVREPVDVLGASRTDAGVHARGQVAAFTCSDLAWPAERGAGPLLRAVNSRLPEDVLLTAAEAVAESFNPISDCTGKGYSYTLHVSPHRALWDRRFVHHVWTPLDVERMNQAAARIVGEHDFAAFAAAGHGRLSTVRRVFECRVVEESESARPRDSETAKRLRIEVSGNGFLWNMVRIIAGTLVEVGRGRMTPEGVTAAIESRDRRKAGPTLPPTGLCLEWVRYDGL
ncbi:MAG: tRNA pseudouridine synthase A [Phycisphaeraceae bacterium]|nr:tRNA pseudouridine synthase A [Phycisphaeraceae bacterium]